MPLQTRLLSFFPVHYQNIFAVSPDDEFCLPTQPMDPFNRQRHRVATTACYLDQAAYLGRP